jgi:hypothetical protein
MGSASLRRREARMISSSAMRMAWASDGPVAHFAHDGFARQRTGDLAVLVAAHAIGDQPQAQLAIAVVGVFVEFPTQANVRQVSEFDHGQRDGQAPGE